jgi:hypothetical protein
MRNVRSKPAVEKMNRCPCGRTEKLWARFGPVTRYSALTIRCQSCLERLLARTLGDVGRWQRID